MKKNEENQIVVSWSVGCTYPKGLIDKKMDMTGNWRSIIGCLFLIFFVLFTPISAQGYLDKTKIAIVDFQLQGIPFDNPDMGSIVAEWFTTAIVQEGNLEVVERRLLKKIIDEQELETTGLVDVENITKIGTLLGVNAIVTGSVINMKDSFEINVRIIDVKSALILGAESGTTTNKLKQLVVGISKKIAGMFPLEGYIVSRNGKSIVLDLGKASGVKKEMHFNVYKKGKMLTHPNAGELLGNEVLKTGLIIISQVWEKTSIAVIESEVGQNQIDSGQLVRSTIDSKVIKKLSAMETATLNAHIQNKGRYKKQSNGTILDPQTGLIWSSGMQGLMSWSQAKHHIKKMNGKGLHGFHNWRIPNREELLRVARFVKVHANFFGAEDAWYWSSTPAGPISSWVVNMGHAEIAWDEFDENKKIASHELPFAVRLVRTQHN